MDCKKHLLAGIAAILILVTAGTVLWVFFKISRQESSSPDDISVEPVVTFTHEQNVGPPLSFETPAYIRIPAIGLNQEVREGSDNEEELYKILELGPIHIPHTAFPGQKGNCVISGHRTTYTRPFNRLDELKKGDVIYIENPRGLYEYTVYVSFLIKPLDNPTLPTPDPVLTLTTCHPEGSDAYRLVVRASLTKFTPVELMTK